MKRYEKIFEKTSLYSAKSSEKEEIWRIINAFRTMRRMILIVYFGPLQFLYHCNHKVDVSVSKPRGKEKVRYKLVQDLAKLFTHPSVKDWNSYLNLLRQNGITVKEKIGKSGRLNLYYCVGKDEFWYKKLDLFLSRENLEKVFRERSEKQMLSSQRPTRNVNQTTSAHKHSATQKAAMQPKPVTIPPLPEGFMGARIAAYDLDRYRKGEAICAYICPPGEIIGRHHWIWYDFKTCQPRCESTPPPADRYIPEAFKQTQSSCLASPSQSQGAGIILSSSSFSGSPIPDEGFAHGNGLPNDFKLWLSRHPGLTIEEVIHRYREEQKQRSRVRLKH